MRNVSDKSCSESHNTFYVHNLFPLKSYFYEIKWKHVVERNKPQLTIWYGA